MSWEIKNKIKRHKNMRNVKEESPAVWWFFAKFHMRIFHVTRQVIRKVCCIHFRPYFINGVSLFTLDFVELKWPLTSLETNSHIYNLHSKYDLNPSFLFWVITFTRFSDLNAINVPSLVVWHWCRQRLDKDSCLWFRAAHTQCKHTHKHPHLIAIA